MMHSRQVESRRRGSSPVALFAILLIPLLGMLAFSIDIGYMTLVRADLQRGAAAAAWAAAQRLQEFYARYTMPIKTNQCATRATATTHTPGSPMDTAAKIAGYNQAGNVSISVRDQDVTFGFTTAH